MRAVTCARCIVLIEVDNLTRQLWFHFCMAVLNEKVIITLQKYRFFLDTKIYNYLNNMSHEYY